MSNLTTLRKQNQNWFYGLKFQKKLTKTSDILCGIIYIPPENSKCAHNDPYFEISEELNYFSDKYESLLLLWDYNSRTKLLNGCIEVDEDLFCENNIEDAYIDMPRDM